MFLIAILTVAALQKKGSSNYINSLTIKKVTHHKEKATNILTDYKPIYNIIKIIIQLSIKIITNFISTNKKTNILSLSEKNLVPTFLYVKVFILNHTNMIYVIN
jgi:hypothetical protein